LNLGLEQGLGHDLCPADVGGGAVGDVLVGTGQHERIGGEVGGVPVKEGREQKRGFVAAAL